MKKLILITVLATSLFANVCLWNINMTTEEINKAVKNNPEKFPDGYIIEITKEEKDELVKKFHRFEKLKHSTVNPKVFTE